MATQKPKTEQDATPAAVENNDCFIIMPIADHPDYKAGHFRRVYEDILAPACQAAGYRPVRADDVAQANLIHLDILQKLIDSPMAICDLSTRNPNVLFELGLRQAFDKPTILVQEFGTPKIFDISILRYIEYHKGLDYRDVLDDQKAIQKVLEETRDAVNDGKNVNSIVKLLSISQPAHLQDASNFGDKEYFQILMEELSRLNHKITQLQKPIPAPTPRFGSHSIRNLEQGNNFKIEFIDNVSNLLASEFGNSLENLNEVSQVKVYLNFTDPDVKPTITIKLLNNELRSIFVEASKLDLNITITPLGSS